MTDEMNRAADAVAALDTRAALDGADALAGAFEAAGERIARSLEGAAKRGELSFGDMAETILKDLARLAVTELLEGPLQALASGLTQSQTGGGAANIVMNISGASDADSFRRSEGQIAAHLARAVGAGSRRVG